MNEEKSKILTEDIIFDPNISEQLKKLVIERVSLMPETLGVSVGSEELTKKDALRHVKDGDEIGNQIIEMELEFLRSLASGIIYTYE